MDGMQLKLARIKCGKRQSQLAAASGISLPTLSNIECSRLVPSAELAARQGSQSQHGASTERRMVMRGREAGSRTGDADESPGWTCVEAGKAGGLETSRRYGRAHFVEAGRRGQQVLRERYTSEDRRRWGQLGGRPQRRRYVPGARVENPAKGGWGARPTMIPPALWFPDE
jgi:DNA-binding XRE family transcriptional regulator